MQNITLNNGVQIPALGFGVFQIPPAETEQAVMPPSRQAIVTSTPRRFI